MESTNLSYKHLVCLQYSRFHQHELRSLAQILNQPDRFDCDCLKQEKDLNSYQLLKTI